MGNKIYARSKLYVTINECLSRRILGDAVLRMQQGWKKLNKA